jgi:ACS family D-galactonate transporter-like MFS transporter
VNTQTPRSQENPKTDALPLGKGSLSAQWVLVFLLALSAGINYIDRGSLSVAAPVLASQLSLTPVQMGLFFSAFFWSYTGFMIVAGWLVDSYSVKWVLGAGYFLWSLATLSTGFAGGLYSLVCLRLLLGLGESVAYPSYSRILAISFPMDQRGFPNSLVDAGAKVGPALGTLVGGLLVARLGWRPLFVIFGVASMAWLVPWCLYAPRDLGLIEKSEDLGPSILQILQKRDAWGTFLGDFSCNYAYYFLLTWLPSYLVTERHLSMGRMAVLGSLPFFSSTMTSILGGWASDRWIRRGATPTLARKTFVVTGLLMATLMLPSTIVEDLRVSMALLVVAYCAFGLFSSNHWAITQTLAGSSASGKWTGLQNACANVAGVAAPFITGLIVSHTGSFYLAFLSASLVLLVGAASYLFLVGRVAPILWRSGVDGSAGGGTSGRMKA